METLYAVRLLGAVSFLGCVSATSVECAAMVAVDLFYLKRTGLVVLLPIGRLTPPAPGG